ncbi:MAG: 16S rRNA (guanine(527)-N(7))-methyltransferase RsmG [Alphaproteobacteria bacterium]|nr:16S rRNA (guanine(527)-N(7))-methyltransferase RsmG [Alphaproteobacteria bacterium]
MDKENNGRDLFFDFFKGVPRGTQEKLDRYANMLREWNEKFNLVAASTLPDLWNRHFLDSAQLLKFLKNGKTIADLGSGAGFPGLVISIMSDCEVHLVESVGKKANFLRAVVNELDLSAVVHQDRAESLVGFRADIITARALKALPELLGLVKPLMKHDSFCLFLKGQNVDAELTEATKCWKFEHEKFESISDRSGSVLIVKNLQAKAGDNVAARRKNGNGRRYR